MEHMQRDRQRARAIKTAQERCRRWKEEFGITAWRYNVALCLAVLLNMDAASAAAWALRPRTWLCQLAQEEEEREKLLQRALETSILDASASCCSSWTDPNMATLGISPLRRATRLCRDKRLRDWVKHRNVACGATVSSTHILRRWHGEGNTEDENGLRLQSVGAAIGDGTQRTWCHRWRKRAKATMRFLRIKEPMTLATKREKVSG